MKRYAVHLCGGPDDPRVVPNPSCPDAAGHAPEPPGYLCWHEWAKTMARTHVQRQCPGCGLYAVWIPKGQPHA